MELDNDNDDNSVEIMEIEYSNNSIETDDNYENFLFQQLPTQTNQNSSTTTIPCSSNFKLLKRNLMFQSIILRSQINRNNHIYKEIVRPNKVEVPVASFSNERKLISINEKTSHSNFEYDSQYVEMHREKVDLNENCDWLNFRLKIHSFINNDSIPIEQVIAYLKSTFLNTVIDLMIYYHTKSHFALQLFNVEALNLLLILKHPKLLEIAEVLTDGFSKDLLSIIRKIQASQETEGISESSFPIIAETMMNNYFQIKTAKRSLKLVQHNFPKIVYYSFYMPTFMIIDGININPILNKKIISLQRKFNCRIIFDGPFMQNMSPATKNEFYRFEIFFDFNVNYWILVIQEFIKYINSFTRCTSECLVDQVCVSHVSTNFFCCDEIKNLMKRHILLREMDTEFVNLIKWVQLNRLDRSGL